VAPLVVLGFCQQIPLQQQQFIVLHMPGSMGHNPQAHKRQLTHKQLSAIVSGIV
jgi:hypothetical protein